MKTQKLILLLALTLASMSRAEEAHFFRIVGPVETTVVAVSVNGNVTWTNAATNATFTVQTTSSLLGQSNWIDFIQVPVTNPITTSRLFDPHPPAGMVLIPAGTFQMGDSFSESYLDERPVHTVYVSAFYMDRYEVTKALWDEVYQWAITNGYSFGNGAQGKAPNHPAHSMTWYDAVKWCNARSEKEGRTPAYYTSLEGTPVYRTIRGLVLNVQWNAGYRLPTEAEWEKAARGGVNGRRFSWPDADVIAGNRANYNSTSIYSYDLGSTGTPPIYNDGVYPITSPVGYFAANGYGLYDMIGNVWEWCWDRNGDTYYSSSPGTDPRGSPTGSYRITRGGSWYRTAFECRVAYRYYFAPDYAFNLDMGFRPVLPASQQ